MESTRYANELGAKVEKTVECTGSAYKEIPKDLKKLTKMSGKQLVFYAVDRFSRRLLDGIEIAKKFLAAGNSLHFVSEKLVLTEVDLVPSNNWNRFVKLLEMAENESASISRRVRSAKSYLKSEGYFTGGKPPFGYKKQREDTKHPHYKLAACASEAAIKRFIIACKTPGSTIIRLDKLLAVCIGLPLAHTDRAEPYLLCFDTNIKLLLNPLTNDNIAYILNDFKVANQRTPLGIWAPSDIYRIYANRRVDKPRFVQFTLNNKKYIFNARSTKNKAR